MGITPNTEVRVRRRELARRQAWWLIGGGAALIAWARLWTRWLDPVGPDVLDWALTLVHALEFQLGIVVALLGLGATWRRERGPAALALLVVLATMVAPALHGVIRTSDARTTERGGPRDSLRVMSVNTLVWNRDLARTADAIRNADPDVVLAQEWGSRHERTLPEMLDGEWSLIVSDVREDSFGVAVFVRASMVDDVEGSIWVLRPSDTPQVRLQLSDQVVLHGVHLLPPINARMAATTKHEVRALRARVRVEPLPVVLLGDFNATGGSAVDRALQRTAGLRNAWSLRGLGLGWTWPANGALRWLPGVRIDHAYVSDELGLDAVRRLPPGGSDHRPLVLDLAVPR